MKQGYRQRVPRSFVGSYRPRTDGLEKASGAAEYLDDLALAGRFPGLLHVKVLRSPYAHARIKSLDVSPAESTPGVWAVLTYQDPQVAALRPTNSGWTPFFTSTYDRMLWPTYRDRRVLSDKVCWVGDEAGVVVAAESPEIAEEALRRVRIEWEVLPFVLDHESAMQPGAPIIHPEINPESNVLPPSPYAGSEVFIHKGDLERAFNEADAVVEVATQYHNADHACLSTRACLMQYQGGQLTCWTSHYQADQTRMHICEMLGLPLNKVRVINPYIGGSFGRGNTGEQSYFLYTAILARRTGRPVLFKHTRREDFHDTRNRLYYECRMGGRKDGTITAVHFKSIGDAGAYADHSMAAAEFVPREFAEGTLAHIPNLKLETKVVYTNRIPGSCMRGIGNNQINLAFGQAVDALAEKLGLDPVEVTLKNFGNEWCPMPDQSLAAVVTEGARRIGWSRRRPPGQGPLIEGRKKRGLGFSIHNSWHAAWQETPRGHIQVSAKVNPDRTVILDAPTAETGPGSNVCAVLACAEALAFLGIGPEHIRWISRTDTERGLKDQVQTDSGVAYVLAEMMPRIGASIKEQLLNISSAALETSPEKLDVKDGVVFVQDDPEKRKSVQEILYAGDLVPILATVSRTLPSRVTGTPFVATFAEVEVDVETGAVEVLKEVVVHDCGTVMYASGAEGQQVGGQAMAVGETLTEEVIYDPATGVPLNFNWIDYKLPTILDVPEVEPVLLEVWRGDGEYPASGIGESVTTCGPAAIANAVYNALGVRIPDIPFKPEKILKALGRVPAGPRGRA
ncbi:MAG: molybdopterin cofactor-binding domain-containing protein [Thermodesulfobacteriota bacterium]